MPRLTSLLILSAATRVRTPACLNHRVYADRYGLQYLFDMTPGAIPSALDQKVASVRRALKAHEWLFWIDDDAFFTNLEFDIRSLASEDADLVICQSPINPEGGWTFVNFGAFLVRRTPAMVELFDAVASTDLESVRATWDSDRHGLFTNTDQDALVHQLTRADAPWSERWQRLDWTAFNCRPYHYVRHPREHAVCHFAGADPKMDHVRAFASRMRTTTALVDADLLEPFGAFICASDLTNLLGPPWSNRSIEQPS